jgi:ribulose-phosphate 3-epimerase
MAYIAPSILSADFGNLQQSIELLNDSAADWIHCDIMDGQFVPNLSFGLPVLEAVHRVATKPLDVHLMIIRPDDYLDAFADAGADILTVHIEVLHHPYRTLQAIRERGMQAGLALNPGTPVEQLRDVLPLCDVVCLMSVNPGFGGQRFLENTYDRLTRLRELIQATEASTRIEIDGGVTLANAQRLIDLGADVLVAGNTVFKAPDPHEAIRSLKSIQPVVA